jgi:hypothetical protein
MKAETRITTTFALALTVLSSVLLTGCNKEQPTSTSTEPKKSIASAEPTSFQQVTSQLEPGGNLYLYVSAEQWVSGLSAKVAGLRQLSDVIPDLSSDARENVAKGFDLVTNLIKDCGIEEITGFGVSSIAREKGFYHTRSLLHHYQGKGSGFLWNLFGSAPHALGSLDLLPSSTAFATFSDLDVPLLWSVLQKEVAQANFPQAQAVLNQLPALFESSTGLKWDKVLASLGGEVGFVLTLDDARKISLPLPTSNGPIELPEPALMLVAKVKDDTIFNRIDEALKGLGQQIISVDKPDRKLRTMQVPLPLPIQLRPTIATSGGYLFVASTDALILETLAVKAGQKPGLKSTAEFQRLAREIPQQGNQYSFLSQRFGQTIVQLQRQALPLAAQSSGQQTEWLQSLLASSNPAFVYTVNANTAEGWLSVGNGNQHPARLLLVGAAVPIGILSAVAIPNFIKARAAAQQHACINNLRQIDAAKQMWALENKKSAAETPTKADLMTYLKNSPFPVCPVGGEYSINSAAKEPECSIAGHTLAKNE